MSDELQDVVHLDVGVTVSQSELSLMCGLSAAEVEELVEYGLLAPEGGPALERSFSAARVQPLRQAAALRARFDLDLFAIGLLLSQIERVSELERQVRSLQARLPQPLPEREGPANWVEPHG